MARFDRKTETFRIYPIPAGLADRRHPAVALLGGGHEGRRQGLGEELGPLAGHEARPRDRRSTRTSARSRSRRTAGRSASTASTPTSRTTPTSSSSATAASARSTPRPARWRSIRRRRRLRGRGAAASISQNRLWFAEYGANGVAHVRSEDREDHRVEEAAARGSRPMTWWPTATARSGRSTNPPTGSAGSIPRPARWVNYPLPRYSQLPPRVRRRPQRPPVVWIGNNHAASVIKLEPLD